MVALSIVIITLLIWFCTMIIASGEKHQVIPDLKYKARAESLCSLLKPDQIVLKKCQKICNNSNLDELFKLADKEFTYIWGANYFDKYDSHNPDHREAALQILLSQSRKSGMGNKILTTSHNGDHGLPIKWNIHSTEKNNIERKNFWCSVYQCIEWNLQEKYPDILFVQVPIVNCNARSRDYDYKWDSYILIPTTNPERPSMRFW